MAALAKLDLEPEAERGPDVVHHIQVPPEWLEDGANFECTLPRRLACARCDGGGCDSCGRSGAVTMQAEGEVPKWVLVHLGSGSREPRGLRLLDQGGASENPTLPNGCLILKLSPGQLSRGVREVEARAVVEGVGRVSLLMWVVFLAVVIPLLVWLL